MSSLLQYLQPARDRRAFAVACRNRLFFIVERRQADCIALATPFPGALMPNALSVSAACCSPGRAAP